MAGFMPVGFVYRVNLEDGTYYIGRKQLSTKRTLKPLKGMKRNRVMIKESKWKEYTGSNIELNKAIE